MKPLTETQKHVYVLLYSWNLLFTISSINFVLVLFMVILILIDWYNTVIFFALGHRFFILENIEM